MKKSEIRERIAELQCKIDEFTLDPDIYEERYRDILDETKSSWIENYDGGRILEEIDPTAYRCGLNDFVDAIEKEESPEYNELIEELEELESELEGA